MTELCFEACSASNLVRWRKFRCSRRSVYAPLLIFYHRSTFSVLTSDQIKWPLICGRLLAISQKYVKNSTDMREFARQVVTPFSHEGLYNE